MSIGILAFGSINEKPGAELATAITRRIEVETPFAVEFARSSRTRDGAPTLVPVGEGGARVPATVLVIDNFTSVDDAREMLYRRETGILRNISSRPHVAWIAELTDFAGTSTCFYAALRPNIQPLVAERLAELAIRSAAAAAGAARLDGISYLLQQKHRGVMTPLMPGYEKAILARIGAHDLVEAWRQVGSRQ